MLGFGFGLAVLCVFMVFCLLCCVWLGLLFRLYWIVFVGCVCWLIILGLRWVGGWVVCCLLFCLLF